MQQQAGAACSTQLPTMKMMMMPPPPTPAPSSIGGGRSRGGGTGLVKAGSMGEQARLAKIPQPETALKCPRCESTNTKFCYFNNYSLTQPRHFCKTCRRYWTRGGALRNVPVGGGCRRNKRSSKRSSTSRSKSPPITSTSSDHHHHPPPLTTSTTNNFPPPPQLPFFAPLDNLSSTNDFANADIGLNFYGIQPPPVAAAADRSGSANAGNEIHDFQIAGTPLLNLSARFADQWKLNHHQLLQQFPNFLSEGEGIHESALRNYIAALESNNSSSSALDLEVQPSHLKLQESSSNHQETELSRNFSGSNDQYWSTAEINTWTEDLSAPSTSTSTAAHLLM